MPQLTILCLSIKGEILHLEPHRIGGCGKLWRINNTRINYLV